VPGVRLVREAGHEDRIRHFRFGGGDSEFFGHAVLLLALGFCRRYRDRRSERASAKVPDLVSWIVRTAVGIWFLAAAARETLRRKRQASGANIALDRCRRSHGNGFVSAADRRIHRWPAIRAMKWKEGFFSLL
jgi:hypothetical protein